MRRFSAFLLALLLSPGLVPAVAGEASVAPGINAPYAKPDVERWRAVFEAEGREVYAKRQAIVAALKLKPGMTLADIGAGTGLFTRLIAPLVAPAGRVYALDIVPGFVEAIERQAREQKLDNVVALVNPPDAANLPARSIDLAFVCDTYHHFEYPQTMLASIRQALRPGGQLVIIDYQKIPGLSSDWVMGHVRAGKATVIQEVEMAGFRLVDDLPLLTENYFLRFEKLE